MEMKMKNIIKIKKTITFLLFFALVFIACSFNVNAMADKEDDYSPNITQRIPKSYNIGQLYMSYEGNSLKLQAATLDDNPNVHLRTYEYRDGVEENFEDYFTHQGEQSYLSFKYGPAPDQLTLLKITTPYRLDISGLHFLKIKVGVDENTPGFVQSHRGEIGLWGAELWMPNGKILAPEGCIRCFFSDQVSVGTPRVITQTHTACGTNSDASYVYPHTYSTLNDSNVVRAKDYIWLISPYVRNNHAVIEAGGDLCLGAGIGLGSFLRGSQNQDETLRRRGEDLCNYTHSEDIQNSGYIKVGKNFWTSGPRYWQLQIREMPTYDADRNLAQDAGVVALSDYPQLDVNWVWYALVNKIALNSPDENVFHTVHFNLGITAGLSIARNYGSIFNPALSGAAALVEIEAHEHEIVFN
jgi:hypothetical protein